MSTEQTEPEKINAALSSIRFKNDNGFLIGIFFNPELSKKDKFSLSSKKNFSGLGTMTNPQVGMEYILTGSWESNQKYGEQFKFDYFETVQPKSVDGIYKYLVRVCKFVGASVGYSIIKTFGENTLKIIKTDPEQFSDKIKGITLERAKKIQKTLLDNEIEEAVSIKLGVMLDVPGIRKSLLGDLIKTFKSKAPDIIEADPYILTNFHGIGFPLADRVAINIGLPRDSILRKMAATMYALRQDGRDGNTWISLENLVFKIKEFIQVPNLTDGIDVLLKDEEIVLWDGFVALKDVSDDELFVANKLIGAGFINNYMNIERNGTIKGD